MYVFINSKALLMNKDTTYTVLLLYNKKNKGNLYFYSKHKFIYFIPI